LKRHSDWETALQSYQYWIFDLDGTLTLPIYDFPAIKRKLGLPTDRGILEVLDEMAPDQARPIAARLESIEADYAGLAKPSPGAGDLLRKLRTCGCRLGILTRNKKAHALVTLEVIGLTGIFDSADIIGRDEAPPKPDPAGLLDLLSRWQAPRAKAIFVGDNIYDMRTGRAAGVPTVLLASEQAGPDACGADYRVGSLTELARTLR